MFRSCRWVSLLLLVLISSHFPVAGQPSPWAHFTLSGGNPSLNGTPPVYDPASNRLIVFGGCASGPWCTGISDTWVLTNANGSGGIPQWQQLVPSGPLPPGRITHSEVYDQANNRMTIFGGGTGVGCGVYCVLLNDVWVISNANGLGGTPTWTQLSPLMPNGAPAPRSAHQAIYDPITNRMTIFGGSNNGVMTIPNDTWVLTNANGLGGTSQWIPLSPAGGSPARRSGFISAYDQAKNRMTVFGGCCPFMGDLWTLSGANGIGTTAWQPITQTSPAPGTLSNWNSGYDQTAQTLLFFGGSPSFGTFRNDVWVLNNANGVGQPAWMNTIPNGAPGSPPAGAPPGTFDAVRKRLMILLDSTDLWVLDATGSLNLSTGTITVTTTQQNGQPLTGAPFTLTKDGAPYASGLTPFSTTTAPAGTYTVTFGAVAGYNTPSPQTATLTAGQTLSFNGSYTPVTLSLCPTASPRCSQSLTFSYQKGVAGPVQPQQVAVSSDGPVLGFSATATSNPPGWLTVLPSTGTTPATLSVGIIPLNNVAPGTYSGQVSVTAADATNSPQALLVTLIVTAGPTPPPNSALSLSFPIPESTSPLQHNITAYTARISSVIDHSGSVFYHTDDGRIVAYTGEMGGLSSGVCSETLYKNPSSAPFVANGAYVGIRSCHCCPKQTEI